jgi:hypothetical protein
MDRGDACVLVADTFPQVCNAAAAARRTALSAEDRRSAVSAAVYDQDPSHTTPHHQPHPHAATNR